MPGKKELFYQGVVCVDKLINVELYTRYGEMKDEGMKDYLRGWSEP